MRNCSLRVSVSLAISVAIISAAMGEEKLETRTVVTEAKIASTARYEFSRSVGPGRLVKVQDGQQGSVKSTYRVTLRGGKPISRELIKEEKTQATPTLYHMGRAGFNPSRSSFSRAKVLTLEATAYDPSPGSNGGRGLTASGTRAGYGQVAVDPRVIPLGSLLFIEGYGFALASDTGGAIKGNRIDLCYNSRGTCTAFGRRKVKVHVFNRR
jgi:3D (Asp-Asp-Asp) domain-containing protein